MQYNRDLRITPLQRDNDVPYSRARRRCDDPDRFGITGQGSFAGRVEQPLLFQLLLKLLISQIQAAYAIRLHMCCIELILAIPFVYRHITSGDDPRTFLRNKRKALVVRGEHDTLNPAVRILQGKIHVAAGVVGEIRDFSPNPYLGQQRVRLQLHPDIPVQFLYGKYTLVHGETPLELEKLIRRDHLTAWPRSWCYS